MVKKAQFFDLDTILDTKAKAWIVDKRNPSIPIMKISKSDFNLYQNGIFRKQGNKIEFNGKTFWLPNDVVNKLKIKVKNHKSNFADLAISLQEFLNKDIIDNLEFDLNMSLLDSLKNTTDDIYIICSKQTKLSHQSIVDKIKEKMKEEGLQIKNFYFISETFYNQRQDEVEYKKLRLLLQHLIGYKTDGNKFIDEEITRYDHIEYYDDNLDTLSMAKQSNDFLNLIWRNTEDGLRSVVKEDIGQYKPQLIVNKINDNKVNKIQTEKVNLSLSNLIKTFESFKNFNIEKSADHKQKMDQRRSTMSEIKDELVEFEDRGDLVLVNSIATPGLANQYKITIFSKFDDTLSKINMKRLKSRFEILSMESPDINTFQFHDIDIFRKYSKMVVIKVSYKT